MVEEQSQTCLAAIPCLFGKLQLSPLFPSSLISSLCEQQPNLVHHLCHGPLLFLKRGPHPNSCPPLSSQAFFLGVGRSQTESIVHATQLSTIGLHLRPQALLSAASVLFLFHSFLYLVCTSCVHVGTCHARSGGQRATCRSRPSPSTTWVPRIDLTSSGLVANALPTESFRSPAFITLYIEVNPKTLFLAYT